MNTRLQQFLDLENITPARLADTLGVQRSGLSHILSGRNKPGYEFITRLLSKFPNINPDWLLMGRGKPYKEMGGENFYPASTGSSQSPLPSGNIRQQNKQNNIPYNSIQSNGVQYNNVQSSSIQQYGLSYNGKQSNGVLDTGIQSSAIQSDSEPILDINDGISLEQENEYTRPNLSEVIENVSIGQQKEASEPSENCVNEVIKAGVGKKKRIKRVIVFYSDGSFEELFPHIG